MRKQAVILLLALVAGLAMAKPMEKTVLTHENGEKTTVTSNENGSTSTGWYGGKGATTPDKHGAAVKEVERAGIDKGNKVINKKSVKIEM